MQVFFEKLCKKGDKLSEMRFESKYILKISTIKGRQISNRMSICKITADKYVQKPSKKTIQ